jgi:rare lipoprotein A
MKKIIKILILICIFSNSIFQIAAEVYKESAVVSFYAEDFHGKKTSNGEKFNMNSLTCASKTLPFNTILKVTNLKNGKSVQVRVNDRGPFVSGRELDLSKAAAKQLDMVGSGIATVKIEIVKMGADTKLSRQTAESAKKIMEKIEGKKTYDISKFYDFQMGAFSSKENAKNLAVKLSKDGFKNLVYQTTSKGIVRLVIKAVPGSDVEKMKKSLAAKGYTEYQIRERK